MIQANTVLEAWDKTLETKDILLILKNIFQMILSLKILMVSWII